MNTRDRYTFSVIAIVTIVLGVVGVVQAQRVPMAGDAARALAPLAVSEDGTKVTIRPAASDDLQVCVAPAAGKFGATRCFRVGDIRAGRVVRR